jgi:hypothetical protein
MDILQLMFIYLKLSGEVDWHWIAVMAPLAIVVIIHLMLYTLRETLIMLSNWLSPEGVSGAEAATGATAERGRIQQDDREAEGEWCDREEDERGS